MENLNLDVHEGDKKKADAPALIVGDFDALVRLRDAINVLIEEPGRLQSIGLPTGNGEVRIELVELDDDTASPVREILGARLSRSTNGDD
jgi:hypothetical protein